LITFERKSTEKVARSSKRSSGSWWDELDGNNFILNDYFYELIENRIILIGTTKE
jgi:CHASE2 domain-containing sensor protein